MLDDEKLNYISRIKELEERIEQLRLSRRVMMSLLENIDKDRKSEISKMLAEHKKLKKTNVRYAFDILQKNVKLLELKTELTTLKQVQS